jgi:hypothetical protein
MRRSFCLLLLSVAFCASAAGQGLDPPRATAEDDARRYLSDKDILIKTPDGAHIAAILVRPKSAKGRLPTLLFFTIYAADMSARRLLTPGKVESIPFDRSRMVSRLVGKGSRLLVTLNVNKSPFMQINYGSGKEVSDEDIKDATTPLQINWSNDSYVKIPVWKK